MKVVSATPKVPQAVIHKSSIKRALEKVNPRRISGAPKKTIYGANGESLYDVDMTRTADAGSSLSSFPGQGGYGGAENSSYGPGREFYNHRLTETFWQIPQQNMFQELNYLRRAIYLRDEIVGPCLDLLSEVPYGDADLMIDDKTVLGLYEDCFNATNLFDFMPRLTLHYFIHGEAIPWHWWDEEKGYWGYLFSIDPNDLEIVSFPYSHSGEIISLVPNEMIKSALSSNDVAYKEVQKNMPSSLLKAMKSHEKVIINPENASYIVRETFNLGNTYTHQIRGQSIIDRLFRIWIYYEKLMEARMSIADNYIYSINVVKLGSDDYPTSDDEVARVAGMIEQARFDVKPIIVYHHQIEFDRLDNSTSFTDLTGDMERLDDVKHIAMGVSKEMLSGDATFAGARTQMQAMLMRLSTLRSKIEKTWLYPKFMAPIAEKNEIYKRTTAQRAHKIRVKNYRLRFFADPENPNKIYKIKEEAPELMIPTINWHTHLHAVQDADYVSQIKDLYEGDREAKGLASKKTYMAAIGLDYQQEMEAIKKETAFEAKLFAEPKEEEEEGGEEGEGKEEKGGSRIPWLKKLGQAIGISDKKPDQLRVDAAQIAKHFLKENDVLYRAGISDHTYATNPVDFYSGRIAHKRQGNLAASFILEGAHEHTNKINISRADITGNAKTQIETAESSFPLEWESSDEVVAFLNNNHPKHFHYLYDQGKRKSFGEKPTENIIKRRKQKILASDFDYSTITNFDDEADVDSARSFFLDGIEGAKTSDKVIQVYRKASLNAYYLGFLRGLMEQKIDNFVWGKNVDETCPICLARAGKQFPVKEVFETYQMDWFAQSHENCIGGESEVVMADGSAKPIAVLRPGEIVMTDEGEAVIEKVSEIDYAGIVYSINGVFCSPDHPFIMKGEGNETYTVAAKDVTGICYVGA